VLVTRARKLKLYLGLPDSLDTEIYKAAAYMLNRSPTRRLGWLSPLGKIQQLAGVRNPQPKLAHLQPYGCRAYALNYYIDKLERLESRVHIGYLVGYESTNIFQVWIPKLSRVIRARDVTFDQTRKYDAKDQFKDITEELVQPIELLPLELSDDDDDKAPSVVALYKRSIDTTGDTIVVDTGTQDHQDHVTPDLEDSQKQRYPITPELTPEPTNY
jgi:hypothetical protein